MTPHPALSLLNRVAAIGVVKMNLVAWLSAVPGIAALIAFFVGYGSLLNRVKNVETNQTKMEVEIATLRGMAVAVGRIDERTETTKGEVAAVNRKLEDIFRVLMREPRSFADEHARG